MIVGLGSRTSATSAGSSGSWPGMAIAFSSGYSPRRNAPRRSAARRLCTLRPSPSASRRRRPPPRRSVPGFAPGVFHSDLGVVNLPSGQPTLRMTGGAGCAPRRDHARRDASRDRADDDGRISVRLRAGHHIGGGGVRPAVTPPPRRAVRTCFADARCSPTPSPAARAQWQARAWKARVPPSSPASRAYCRRHPHRSR